MDFLKIIAVPHSTQVLKLLEILFFIGFSILILYFAYLFGNLIYSFWFYLKSKSSSEYYIVSQKYLEHCCKGYLGLFGLGLIPLLAVYYCLVQFLQKAPQDFAIVFIASFALFLIFVFVSKILLKLHYKSTSSQLFLLLYVLGIVSIFLSSFFTIGIFSVSINTNFKFSGIQPFEFLSFDVISRSLVFIGIALVIASLGYIFRTYSIDRIESEGNEFTDYTTARRLLSNTLIFGNILPIFFFAEYLTTPKNLVTLQNFVFLIISLLILLFSLILTYYSFKNKRATFARTAFIFSIFAFAFFFASETTLLAVSNKVQEFKIAKDYIAYHEQQLALAGRKVEVAVNGEEIYKSKCVACHQFETKLVGPPHKEVLKKYANRKDDMVKFILNPVKVDPAYPPMPNQGLKPNEAKAVVDYMFEHYGNMIK